MTPEKETPTPKIVEEVVAEFKQEFWDNGDKRYGWVKHNNTIVQRQIDWLRTTLTQDRAALHTSLVAAVEGKKRVTSYCGYSFSKSTVDVKTAVECINGAEKMGYNKALKDTLTIINSIFKE